MATTVTARQLPGRLLRWLSVVIATTAIALVALTISQWRPDDARPAPGTSWIDSLPPARCTI